jgi:RNA polymerase sigma-70 factor (ECF subfamily)
VTIMQIGSRYNPAGAKFSSYLYGIVRNLVRRRLTRDRWRAFLDLKSPAAVDAPGLVIEHEGAVKVERRQMVDAARKAIVTLPFKYREVIVLCDLNGMSYENAAGLMRITNGTIRSRLSRARTLLAKRLQVHETLVRHASGSKGVLHERSASEPIG